MDIARQFADFFGNRSWTFIKKIMAGEYHWTIRRFFGGKDLDFYEKGLWRADIMRQFGEKTLDEGVGLCFEKKKTPKKPKNQKTKKEHFHSWSLQCVSHVEVVAW